jgi:hypothetical protein
MNISFTRPSYESLQPYLGVSRINLWHCPKCPYVTLPCNIRSSEEYFWGAVLTCGSCQSSWLVCTACSKVRLPFLNPNECSLHHHHLRKHHNGKKEAELSMLIKEIVSSSSSSNNNNLLD